MILTGDLPGVGAYKDAMSELYTISADRPNQFCLWARVVISMKDTLKKIKTRLRHF